MATNPTFLHALSARAVAPQRRAYAGAPMVDYAELMAAAAQPADCATLAFAGVMSLAASRTPPYDVPIAGVGQRELAALLAQHFPGFDAFELVTRSPESGVIPGERQDEFDDLVVLLGEHRRDDSALTRWVAHALATGSMGENHLWQDMGFPERRVLSELIATYFPSLSARNAGDMKWKKFFYRQLCERAEVLICKSPSCGVCVDYHVCFGKEEGAARVPARDTGDDHAHG